MVVVRVESNSEGDAVFDSCSSCGVHGGIGGGLSTSELQVSGINSRVSKESFDQPIVDAMSPLLSSLRIAGLYFRTNKSPPCDRNSTTDCKDNITQSNARYRQQPQSAVILVVEKRSVLCSISL